MKGIGSWLTKRCEINGNKLAIVFKERRLTYNDFNRRVNRLANGLSKLGVRKGDRVAVMLMNGNVILEGFFACAKLGAVVVPINFRLSPDEVEYILNDTGAKIFIYYEEVLHVVEEVRSRVHLSYWIQVGDQPGGTELGYELLLDENTGNEPDFDVNGEDLFMLPYTSGTTARPKGVMLTHETFQWIVISILNSVPFRTSDINLTVMPLFHLGGMTAYTMPILYQGGTVVIDDKFEPIRVLEMIEREKITCLSLVPTMLLAIKNTPEIDKYNTSSIWHCETGGSPVPTPIIEFYQKRGIPIVAGYGMTEANGIITILDEENYSRKIGSVGKPFMHIEVRIVDDNDNDVPRDQAGELLVRGPNVMKGYWNRLEATREVLTGGWYYSGDIARMDEEGFIYIVDRKKDMIISGSENISSTEIEHVLGKHPNIREVSVIGVPDEKWGETVMAVVILNDISQPLTIEDLQVFCDGKLARYKYPRLLKIVSDFPRTALGKVSKVTLRNMQ